MKVTFHGVRGSTPCQSDDIRRYGGNTSCVSIEAPGQDPLLLDMGTGLRYYGKKVPTDRPFRGQLPAHPSPLGSRAGSAVLRAAVERGRLSRCLRPGARRWSHRSTRSSRARSVRHFSRSASTSCPARSAFTTPPTPSSRSATFDVMARLIPHLGPTLGFRVGWQGRSFAYLSDHQQPFDGSYCGVTRRAGTGRRCRLLIHDAQYTQTEFKAKSTWGHCTIDYAVWLALRGRCEASRALPSRSVAPRRRPRRLLACAVEAGARRGVEVIAASEGLTVELA